MRRPTISDIAQRAGVTKAAVSFALNGQPGVSAATRERVLAIAAEVGYQPSSAARALTAGRAGAFGLVIAAPAGPPAIGSQHLRLISGIQAGLAPHQVALQFTTAEDTAAEIGLYRQWWAQRRVDGIFVVDPRTEDRRFPVIRELGLPAVVIGGPGEIGGTGGSSPLPFAGLDERAAAETVVGYLATQGHRRVALTGGDAGHWQAVFRRDAFAAAAAAAGLTALPAALADDAAEAAERLLGSTAPPTAVVGQDDLAAAAALGVAQRLGMDVPGQVSVISWEDSALCELLYPAVTALRQDVAGTGTAAARLLRELASGGRPESVITAAPELEVRASTGPSGVGAVAAGRRSRRTA
jgi:DNA-binding LacI/PurR family transcriptional regulator